MSDKKTTKDSVRRVADDLVSRKPSTRKEAEKLLRVFRNEPIAHTAGLFRSALVDALARENDLREALRALAKVVVDDGEVGNPKTGVRKKS